MIPLKCFKRQIENDSSLKISNLASSCCNLNSSWEPRRDEEWLVDALIFWRSLLIVLYFFSPLAIWSLIFKHWFIIWFGCMVWGLFLAPVHRMKNRTREGMMGWRYKLESIRKADPHACEHSCTKHSSRRTQKSHAPKRGYSELRS